MAHAPDLRRGALAMVASALLFSAMGAAVKVASGTLPNTVIVFSRNAVALLTLLPLVPTIPGGLRTRHLGNHLVRGLGGTTAMFLFFWAIAHLRLADAVLLNYSIPLFIPFVERAWLREPFPARLWGPILLGFLGIALILRPGTGVFQIAALAALLSAAFAAVAQVGIRRLTHTEPVRRIVLYFAGISTLVSGLALPFDWAIPPLHLVPVLVATGVLASLGQLCLTRAYAHAPASQVGPFVYSAVIFAALFDWLLWGHLPDRVSAVGAGVVVLAGILALRGEGRPAEAGPSPV